MSETPMETPHTGQRQHGRAAAGDTQRRRMPRAEQSRRSAQHDTQTGGQTQLDHTPLRTAMGYGSGLDRVMAAAAAVVSWVG